MSLTDKDPTVKEKRHGAPYVQFISNILRGIAYYIEWAVKFILYLALHSVDVLEALTAVLLQVFRVIKLLIKTCFTFGVLLRYIGRSFGAEGSYLFVLCLWTYFCFRREDGSFVSSVSGALHSNMCILTLCIWALTIPIGGILVFVRLRRKIRQQIDMLRNYEKFYNNEFADKSTKTASRLRDMGSEGQGMIIRETFEDESTETEWTIPDSGSVRASDDDEMFSRKDPASYSTERLVFSSGEGTEKDENEERWRSGEKGGRGNKKKSAPRENPTRRTRDKKRRSLK